jgi:hypothetical protein
MFYFRINKLKIRDNRESPEFLGLFGPDLAEVKLFSFVTTGDADLPNVDELLSGTNEERKKAILSAAVQHVASSRILTTVENIKDNHVMTFGDTGYVLYQSNKMPDDFNWVFLAIESDRDVREIGQEMEEVFKDKDFDGFTTNVLRLLSAAVNPSYIAAVEIAKFITKVVVKNLKKDREDMIGVLYMSLNRREHYPHGERKKDDVSDLTDNMLIDYSIFGFDE